MNSNCVVVIFVTLTNAGAPPVIVAVTLGAVENVLVNTTTPAPVIAFEVFCPYWIDIDRPGPVGPWGPVIPVGPTVDGPVGPVIPVVPVIPVGPMIPLGPVAPVFVASPAGPVTPVGPVAP